MIMEKLFENFITNITLIRLMAITSFDELRNEDERMVTFYGKDREKIEKILEIILIESRGVNPYKEYFIETCLNMLITMVVNKIMTTEGRTDEWEELEKFIENNLGERITLEELAKKCYYNPSYFNRLFKSRFGVNLSSFIERKRIEYAKKLLLTGNTIEYIIEKAGFSSKHIFYEQFKKVEEITVSEFRRQEKI